MTIKQQYESKRRMLEKYCRQGMTVKQISREMGLTPVKTGHVLKALKISLIRLRHEGYANVE
jgi:hypothetical protein